MIRNWFDTREATQAGAALADSFAATAAGEHESREFKHIERALKSVISRAESELKPLNLNFFKRAKFANSFRWRLVEKGLDQVVADQITQSLVMHLAVAGPITTGETAPKEARQSVRPGKDEIQALLGRGNKLFAQQDYPAALECYEELLTLDPLSADATNNVGSTLCKMGRFSDAEQYYRHALSLRADYPEAHSNLADVLRWRGQLHEAERHYRRALKAKPNFLHAQCSLGLVLVLLGQLRDARARFTKVLKARPRYPEALLGLGQISAIEGNFAEAESRFARALEIEPKSAVALAAIAGIRRMTSADGVWLEKAQALADGGLPVVEEAALRHAIGKYLDDVKEFDRAFASYKRANDIVKPLAGRYSRENRERFVDDMVRTYSLDVVMRLAAQGSESDTPILLTGMPRSGTSLTDQILSSHPSIRGAGELTFWGAEFVEGGLDRTDSITDLVRSDLVTKYLQALQERAQLGSNQSTDASIRIVDKATFNSDLLGLIHAIFPRARMIYMRRDPKDICLSCYFQQLPLALNFALDLADLAHYYRQHSRLMDHWRSVLPKGTLLEVPYEELVADQAGWTRRILDFLDLPWDDRCLNFHETERPVSTASFWQVRQKMFTGSLQRWRNYEKHLGALKGLR